MVESREAIEPELDGLRDLPGAGRPRPTLRPHRHRDHGARQRHRHAALPRRCRHLGGQRPSSPGSCCCRSNRTRPAISMRSRRSSRRDACLVSYNGRSLRLAAAGDALSAARPPATRLWRSTWTCCRSPVRSGSTACPTPAWPVSRPPSAACAATTTCPVALVPGPLSRLPPLRPRRPASRRPRAQPPGCRLHGAAAAGAGAGPGAGGTHRALPAGVHPGDLGGLGRAYARKRRHEEALACFDCGHGAVLRAVGGAALRVHRHGSRTDADTPGPARGGRGRLARHRARGWALRGAGPGCTWPSIASTTRRDFRAALAGDRARRARSPSAAGSSADRDRHVERDLARRVPRLRRRLEAAAALRPWPPGRDLGPRTAAPRMR